MDYLAFFTIKRLGNLLTLKDLRLVAQLWRLSRHRYNVHFEKLGNLLNLKALTLLLARARAASVVYIVTTKRRSKLLLLSK